MKRWYTIIATGFDSMLQGGPAAHVPGQIVLWDGPATFQETYSRAEELSKHANLLEVFKGKYLGHFQGRWINGKQQTNS